jgi:hypothetical protein
VSDWFGVGSVFGIALKIGMDPPTTASSAPQLPVANDASCSFHFQMRFEVAQRFDNHDVVCVAI